jgi:hypothetical protein
MDKRIKRVNGRLVYRGESFPGFNKPKNAPAGDEKKKVVLAKEGDTIKKLKYGQRGYEDYTQHKDAGRRKNFRSRMNCSSATSKLTPRYWACKDLW